MTIDDVKISIKNHIINCISTRDLYALCGIFNISTTNKRKQIQINLLDSILNATDLTLLHHILFMLNKSNGVNGVSNNNMMPSPQMRIGNQSYNLNRQIPCVVPPSNFNLNSRLYCLSSEVFDRSPINVRSEIVPGVNPQFMFVPNFTRYPHGHFNAPSSAPVLANGRVNLPNAQLPYTSKSTTIKASPFYCCQVVLHPLSLLIPKPTPNIPQPNRIMSKIQLNFTLSHSVRQLINTHRCQINNKRIYKWQVLLRFGAYDPVNPFPIDTNDISHLNEYIPPYLSLSVNNTSVPLWDILPSNNSTKEGRRHSRPINISDFIKYDLIDDQGYRQIINVNWWQTPSVYLYYYAAVFLERKLDVNELLNQFIRRTHSVQRPITFTLDFIREKFSTNNKFKLVDDDGNDDDLIMSSVLPVSLQCPVGKSRISCPLRSINCQHLQCFDAHLYLMMNERRSIWKCPVCDGQATMNELFVDEYFAQILKDFEKDEDITEVNVNPDGTYVSVAVKESREGKRDISTIISKSDVSRELSTVNISSTDTEPVVLIESDDEENVVIKTNSSTINMVKLPPKESFVTKVNEPVNQILQLSGANEMAIDLTSDSDEDVQELCSKKTDQTSSCASVPGLSKLIQKSQEPPDVSRTPPQPHNHNPCMFPKLHDTFHSMPEILNFSTISFNDNLPNRSNTFARISNNTRLIPGTKQASSPLGPNNIPWLHNQNLMYGFPGDHMSEFISQSLITNHTLPLVSDPISVSSLRKHPNSTHMSNISDQHLQHYIASLSRPIKEDPYIISALKNTKGSVSSESRAQSTTSSKSQQQKKQKGQAVNMRCLLETRGSRRSSRIESQSKKKYIEESSSGGDDDINESDSSIIGNNSRQKRKKVKNTLDDSSDSFGSEISTRKRRK